MKILSLESSTKNFSLAVTDGDKILASRDLQLKKVLSSSIMPGIRSILKKSRLELSDCDGFAVGLGPGSFTSLRVGLATIKALSFAVGRPIVGISSLDILALNAPESWSDPICTFSDAKRKLVFAATFERSGRGLKRTSDYLLTSIDEALKIVKPGTYVVGDGIPLFKEQIKSAVSDCHLAPEKDFFPRAVNLAVLARQQFLDKNFQSASDILPLYLYPEDCQIK